MQDLSAWQCAGGRCRWRARCYARNCALPVAHPPVRTVRRWLRRRVRTGLGSGRWCIASGGGPGYARCAGFGRCQSWRKSVASQLLRPIRISSPLRLPPLCYIDTVFWQYTEYQAVQRITRFDVFNLQYRLPRWLLQIPYELLNRYNRNRLLDTTYTAASISHTDFFVSDDPASSLDLFYVATKSLSE